MIRHFKALVLAVLLLLVSPLAWAEPMVQYFNTSWKEIANKMPELAEAGYESIWLPPPPKGSGGLSVGYDLWDRFDLGSKDQRGSVSTRYGTEADLLELVRTAHRFGIRVYFDNIMNHNAFDVPGFNESVPVDVYPGLLPEDFHLRVTEEGFYRKWDNTRNWGDAWQVQNLGLSDLIDIAHENPNTNFGRNEGDDHPNITFVRHPDNPDYYFDIDLPQGADGDGITLYTFADKEPFTDTGWGASNTGAGNGRFDWDDTNSNGQHDNGETSEPFVDLGLYPNAPARQSAATGASDGVYNMGNPVVEDVNAMLIRASRWLFDRTHVDGLRLDAVKHVPDYFFGQLSGANKDRSGAGYNGGSQTQFNLTRGFSDWSNHRDSVFSTEIPRDDAMLFGEHLGQPPGFGGYIDSGMRLVDNDLRSKFNNVLGNQFNGLNGLENEGSGGFASAVAVTHAQSHDNDFAAMRELQHAMYFTRAGLPLVYTDGNFQAETLSQSGGAFPRHANTNFLGQFGDPRLPNLMQIHQAFARGFQVGVWSDADLVAYERRDERENPAMTDADEVTSIVLVNDNTANGQRPFDRFGFSSAFPAGAYLYQYAVGPAAAGDSMTPFYTTMGDAGGGRSFFPDSVTVPRGGYFVFSWRTPEEAPGWQNGGGSPIEIYQNGSPVGSVTVSRRDGPDGDPSYNPLGLPDADATDFTYEIDIPRVTNGSDLDFVTRVDGSAADVLMKLDGGVDLNDDDPGLPGATGTPRDSAGMKRDFPPAYWEPRPPSAGSDGAPFADSTDVYLGYERTVFRERGGPEKFAAVDRNRSTLGSPGAETYSTTVGNGVNGPTTNNPTPNNTIGYIEHDPGAQVDGEPGGTTMFDDSGAAAVFWIRTTTGLDGYFPYVYYTIDSTNPEGAGGNGAGGNGAGSTTVLPMTFVRDSGGHSWFKAEINPKPSGELRYKLSSVRKTAGGNPLGIVFPSNAGAVTEKLGMMSVYEITGFDATTVQHRPHNDHGDVS
ncbi:MAG: glycosidase, partial [Verrucomicrobiales bacterium]